MALRGSGSRINRGGRCARADGSGRRVHEPSVRGWRSWGGKQHVQCVGNKSSADDLISGAWCLPVREAKREGQPNRYGAPVKVK